MSSSVTIRADVGQHGADGICKCVVISSYKNLCGSNVTCAIRHRQMGYITSAGGSVYCCVLIVK